MIYKNAELHNVEEVIPSKDNRGYLLCRLPDSLRITLNESAKERALSAAGCEVRFNIKDETAKITLGCEGDIPAIAEVFQGVFRISHCFIDSKPTEISVSIPQNIDLLEKVAKERGCPFDTYLTRVILPYTPQIRLIDIKGEVSPPQDRQVPERRYLAYGSSITHGSSAIRPTGTYAMKTAQLLEVDLINLGFGGGAHCERQLADYIAERKDWDFATLEMGINMVGGFETEEFKKRVNYFITKIAKAHPDKWVFCIDLFSFYGDFDPASTKQDEFREVVQNTVKRLGMPKVVHIDGREILQNISGLTGDLVHPSSMGMEEMAINLSNIIKRKIEG